MQVCVWLVQQVIILMLQTVKKSLCIGNKSCATCSIFKCLTCVAGPNCTLCDDRYYLDSIHNSCLSCQYPCLFCSLLATNCTSCINNYYAYNGTNCNLCNYTKPHCMRCSSTFTCI
jgi:hypothetical protein